MLEYALPWWCNLLATYVRYRRSSSSSWARDYAWWRSIKIVEGRKRWITNLLCGLPHEHESLSVWDDLGSIQSLLEVIDELLLVATERLPLRTGDDLGRTNTLSLERGQATSEDSFADESDWTHISTLKIKSSRRRLNNSPGVPASSALMAVHFPVPFWPAWSRILVTRGSPSSSLNFRML